MNTCSSCGATLKPELSWCWLCLTPVKVPELQPATVGGTSPALAPDEPTPQYSRWRAGPTTFGPVGRISITLVVAAVGVLVFFVFRIVDGPIVVADVGIYGVGAFFLLRHVWKRERVA